MKEINTVVAQLLKEGATKDTVVVKSASEYTKNDITRVKLILNKPIRGMIADDETGEMIVGETNTIFVSLSSIAAVFGENPDTVELKQWVKEKHSSLRILLANASIDVISEDVSGDVEYINPFSENCTAKSPKGYNSIYHHVVKISLSPKGMEAVKEIDKAILGI